MIDIIDMIDDPNEVEQDVLEEIDPDLVSYTFSTRGGESTDCNKRMECLNPGKL